MSDPAAVVTLASVRLAAMDHLARREHSARELEDKLRKRFAQPELAPLVATVVAQLRDEGLQSDARFAESWVNHRGSRGMGPALIAGELRRKGVSREILREALYATIDWDVRCHEVLSRKFNLDHRPTPAEKARWMRFLAQRGFEPGQVRAALREAGQQADDC